MLGSILKKLRKSKNLYQKDVASKIGITREAYTQYELDKRQPDFQTLRNLADFFGVSVSELLGEQKEQSIPYDSIEWKRIPVIGTIRAGLPIDRVEDIDGYEEVEADLVRGRDAFILRVQGDSMIGDGIYEGDRVVVIKQSECTPQDISVVAVNGDEATLKRVKFQDDMCMLTPSNPDMEPMLFPARRVQVLGVVIEVRRTIKR